MSKIIDELALEPRPTGVKKLKGSETYIAYELAIIASFTISMTA